jgi:hypothetical protein
MNSWTWIAPTLHLQGWSGRVDAAATAKSSGRTPRAGHPPHGVPRGADPGCDPPHIGGGAPGRRRPHGHRQRRPHQSRHEQARAQAVSVTDGSQTRSSGAWRCSPRVPEDHGRRAGREGRRAGVRRAEQTHPGRTRQPRPLGGRRHGGRDGRVRRALPRGRREAVVPDDRRARGRGRGSGERTGHDRLDSGAHAVDRLPRQEGQPTAQPAVGGHDRRPRPDSRTPTLRKAGVRARRRAAADRRSASSSRRRRAETTLDAASSALTVAVRSAG